MRDLEIHELLDLLLNGSITDQQRQQLLERIRTVNDQRLEEEMRRAWESFVPRETMPSGKANDMLINVLNAKPAETRRIPHAARSRFRSKSYWTAAAVVIICLLAAGKYLFPDKRRQARVAISLHAITPPKETRAVLTLSNHKKIMLDSAANGALALEGQTTIVKSSDGRITYRANSAEKNRELNTLTVPRGSRITTITLSDGTRVWLNAGSSLTYPVGFSDADRVVSVTGETYFEVSHDAQKPFIVRKGETQITVLGTHFNVNAYDDEESMKVTLLEGRVQVNDQYAKYTMKPGQMVSIRPKKPMTVIGDPDLEQVAAWRNGRFNFTDAGVTTVMKELCRWYDIEVNYADNIAEHFYMETGRNKDLSEVLKIMEATGGVHFLITGRKITVMK